MEYTSDKQQNTGGIAAIFRLKEFYENSRFFQALVLIYQNAWSDIHEVRGLHIPLHENLNSRKQFKT
jgi:hypothetical protein